MVEAITGRDTEGQGAKNAVIQRSLLQLLVKIATICDEHGLTYYLSGGTFLGAVRGKGFIPWDDDVDLAMPRPDYQRLVCLLQAKKCDGMDYIYFKEQDEPYSYHLVVEDRAVKVTRNGARKQHHCSVWVDIFPLDGLPQGRAMRKIHGYRLLFHRMLLRYSQFDEHVQKRTYDRTWYELVLIKIGEKINIQSLLNTSKCMMKIDRILQRYAFDKAEYIFNFMGSYKLKSIMNKEKIYAEGAYYEFEGYRFRAPKDYDAYLTQIYGNYMQPPPENQKDRHNLKNANEREE